MKPVDFPEANVVFAKDQKEYLPLPAHKDADGVVNSCWEFTDAEIETILLERKIFISQSTFNQLLQPIRPHTELNN